jgi:hypothetical protein
MQGSLYLVLPAAVYLVLVAALAFVASRTGRAGLGRPIVAAAAALAVFLVALPLFEATVLDLRSGAERAGSRSRDDFVRSASLAFACIYLVVLAVALGLGRVLGRSWRAAAVSGALTLAFLAFSFRYVEFLNACNIGEPVVWPSYIEC